MRLILKWIFFYIFLTIIIVLSVYFLSFHSTTPITQGRHSLSKIRHGALFAKDITEEDQICRMACVQPISLGGGKRMSGWQPVSPQVSPSNEL